MSLLLSGCGLLAASASGWWPNPPSFASLLIAGLVLALGITAIAAENRARRDRFPRSPSRMLASVVFVLACVPLGLELGAVAIAAIVLGENSEGGQ